MINYFEFAVWLQEQSQKWIGRLALAIISALLLWLAFPPFEVDGLAWLALLPFFFAIRGVSVTAAAALAACWAMVFYAFTLSWFLQIFSLVAFLPWAVLAAFSVGWAVSLVYVQRRLPRRWYPVLAALFWVAWDYLRCEGSFLAFPWMQLGFTQANCLPVLQSVSVVGIYGLTFIIVLVNAGVYYCLTSQDRKARPLVLAVSLGLPVLFLVTGWLVIPEGYGPLGPVVVAVQAEGGAPEEYEEMTRSLADWKPHLVVWPEYSLSRDLLRDPALFRRFCRLAREMKIVLVACGKTPVPPGRPMNWITRRIFSRGQPFYSTALVFSSRGQLLGRYHKRHPMPFSHGGIPGTAFPVFRTRAGVVGVAISADFDFAPVSRELVANGAEILAVPVFGARDWAETPHLQHAAMAVARAVEHRRVVVRATSSGVSQIIAPDGRLLGHLPGMEPGTIAATVPLVRGRSLHDLGGFLLPYLFLFLAVLTLLAAAGRQFKLLPEEWFHKSREPADSIQPPPSTSAPS